MLSPEQKQDILKKITESNTFKKSTTSAALLEYLLKCDLENKFLKESIIDIDFFGKKEGIEPTSNRVRVSIFNLRKKLNEYYENEGKSDDWRTVIEKGQYSIDFIKYKPENPIVKRVSKNTIIPYLILALLLLVVIILHMPDSKPKLWQSFLSHDKESTIFIGDIFGFSGKTITGGDGWTCDYNLNSIKEYNQFLNQNPSLIDQTKQSNGFYSTEMGAYATHDITKLFTQYNHDLNIRFITNSSINDLKNRNSIYVASTLNDNMFISNFNKSNPYFKIRRDYIEFANHPELPFKSFTFNENGLEAYYAFVAKFSTDGENEQLIFISNRDVGVIKTCQLFTNKEFLKSFENKYMKDSKYFGAVYKVSDLEKSNMNLSEMIVVPF